MASKALCSRCRQLAVSSVRHLSSPTSETASRRAITSFRAGYPLTKREIHHSTRRWASPATESSSQQTAKEIPPYSPPSQAEEQQNDRSRTLLKPNNLFQSFTNSPVPQIRKRAAFMRQNAYCPHPDHQATRAPLSPNDPETRKSGSMLPAHVRYECPDCGIPVSCSEQHFVSDYESHLEICDVLREINEDDHDLMSGRFFPEFEYPGPNLDEAQVNLMNWDTLLYSREFTAINNDRSMRQVTRLLTYPITIGSVLHELSPYSLKDRLLPEGLRSLSG